MVWSPVDFGIRIGVALSNNPFHQGSQESQTTGSQTTNLPFAESINPPQKNIIPRGLVESNTTGPKPRKIYQ